MRESLEYIFCPMESSGSWQETNGVLKRVTEENLMKELSIYRGMVSEKEPAKDGEAPGDQQQCKATAAWAWNVGGGSVVVGVWWVIALKGGLSDKSCGHGGGGEATTAEITPQQSRDEEGYRQ